MLVVPGGMYDGLLSTSTRKGGVLLVPGEAHGISRSQKRWRCKGPRVT